ncbi:MAG: PP2C family protein-serine/threonine phosphatase [Phycisphaerae bacterium]
MSRPSRGPGTSTSVVPSLHWWSSLHFRLALTINLLAVSVLGAFWVLDYRRERAAHLNVEIERLLEEAKVLRVARVRLQKAEDFQEFLDTFCRQMGVAASPGHHIAVFDARGDLVARAHERADAALESKMNGGHGLSTRFEHEGEKYLSVQVPVADGARIVVTQSLAPIEEIIRAQALSRAASLGILAALVFGVTTIMVLHWVRDPLRELVTRIRELGSGRFDVRVRSSGSPELRYLAKGVNEMAGALETVEKQREAQMRRARAIQTRLLPRNGAAHGSYDVTAVFRPADGVAGDLFDMVDLTDGSMLLAVLDVSGHGVAAALYTALLRTVLRHQARMTCDLAAIVEAMNDEFRGVAGGSGEFATCFLIRLDHATGALEYVGAGHDPAIIIRAGGSAELLEGQGLPIGVQDRQQRSTSRSVLRRGDRLFLYTDGLHEVFDNEGRRFGRERLTELLAETSRHEPKEQLRAVIRGVRSFLRDSGFADDVTLLCVRRNSVTTTRRKARDSGAHGRRGERGTVKRPCVRP